MKVPSFLINRFHSSPLQLSEEIFVTEPIKYYSMVLSFRFVFAI
jgi:hypothetical protein